MNAEQRSTLVAINLRNLAALDAITLTAMLRSGRLQSFLREYADDLYLPAAAVEKAA